MQEKVLNQRMYFLVLYQLSGRQGCIQAGHAALEYALKYGRYNPNAEIWDFIEKHKTFYVMNGGTVNDALTEFYKETIIPTQLGTLNVDLQKLKDVNYPFAAFHEPDLNNTMTAICFICDERVFNRDEYPDFFFPNFKQWLRNAVAVENKTLEELYEEEKSKQYAEFVIKVGKDVAVLKDILSNKRFF